MRRISFSDGLAIAAIVLTVVLVVLDKAGKLTGTMLFILLAIAALMTLPLALGNSWVASASGIIQFFRAAFMLSIVSAGYFGLAAWISPGNNESARTTIAPAPPAPVTPSVEEPTILVQYSQRPLPIAIPQNSSLLVLQLTPYVQDQTMEIKNNGSETMWWPRQPPNKRSSHAYDSEAQTWVAYACELSSHTDKAFLDVRMVFDLMFIAVEPVKATAVRKPDGTVSLSVDMDTTRTDDPMSFAFVDHNNRVIAGTSGELLRTHRHEVTDPGNRKRSSGYALSRFTNKFIYAVLASQHGHSHCGWIQYSASGCTDQASNESDR